MLDERRRRSGERESVEGQGGATRGRDYESDSSCMVSPPWGQLGPTQ